MGDRALVTGGAGVIGRPLIDELCRRGDSVRCVDVSPPPPWLPDGVDYLQADLRRLDHTALSAFEPTTLYHLAATFERGEEAPAFWRENAQHNVVLSQRLLEAAERCSSLDRIVFASSYLVYDPASYLRSGPPAQAVALREDSAIRPRNVCGAAKLLHEHELELASRARTASWSAVFARIYRVYGWGSHDVIGRWVRAALRGDPLTVYGAESFFDYVFADDVARALLLLGGAEITGPVNVATGVPRKATEVVEILLELFPSLQTTGGGEVARWEASVADVSALQSAVGWVPETSLEQGIRKLVEHEREAGGTPRFVGWSPHAVGPAACVLISSASRKVPLLEAFREAFLGLGVDGCLWAADADARAASALAADRFWQMPPLEALTDQDLLEFCKQERIQLVVPTRDGELARFAALRERFTDAGVNVAVSSTRVVECCDDKLA